MMTLKRPPMGWNSWDCYGAAVNEAQVRANAEYMAKNLKAFGWEYIVVDIQWYEPNAVSHEYNRGAELVMDDFGRLMPAVNRFPSAEGGKGFRPLADYVHSLGLKFGIHILRGIPRQAIRRNTPVMGTDIRAAQIADFGNVCSWNGDMCGVDMSRKGAQEYYDSLFGLYAGWGVDYVKVDDIARPYRREEVEGIAGAMEHSGRAMVLSLSPGAAPIAQAEHLAKWANMWRMTDDFWDSWEPLKKMFDYCREWFPYVGENHFPDCDMLPLGRIRLCNTKKGENTKFTEEEQKLLMTLWAIFRSPLMFGGDMTMNDPFTLSLMQNREIIDINQNSRGGREVYRKGNEIVWAANGADHGVYLAHFNVGDEEIAAGFDTEFLGIREEVDAREIWSGEEQRGVRKVKSVIPPHGVRLYLLSR
ncbi:MAG: glycoside hydrolase family 27 protein [Blautia sp.]|nr:glycoside hydrolase family 27 protein [Blautia sp.]